MIVKNIAQYLSTVSGIGTLGTNLFIEHLPDSPDNVIVLFSTGGLPTLAHQPYDDPTFQVRVRHTDQETAFTNIQRVYGALQNLPRQTISGTLSITVQALQSAPFNIGRDAAQRCEYTQNFFVRIKNDTTHRG